ncbi:MAG TPA: hypothetical protein EYH40_04990 [Desulfurococcales archaeon]|nr:hypothetical protein [Desulfurococcales archaeon]
MKSSIRRLVLDVLKPLKEPSIVDMARALAELKGVSGVNITVNDVDVETMGLIITIEGDDIDFEQVKKIISDMGAVIHSVDQVIVGSKVVETVYTPTTRQ